MSENEMALFGRPAMNNRLFRIEAPHFVAGLAGSIAVFEAAPILSYMKGWGWERVAEYCNKKGWKLEEIK